MQNSSIFVVVNVRYCKDQYLTVTFKWDDSKLPRLLLQAKILNSIKRGSFFVASSIHQWLFGIHKQFCLQKKSRNRGREMKVTKFKRPRIVDSLMAQTSPLGLWTEWHKTRMTLIGLFIPIVTRDKNKNWRFSFPKVA